jgi:hypothetical protein
MRFGCVGLKEIVGMQKPLSEVPRMFLLEKWPLADPPFFDR